MRIRRAERRIWPRNKFCSSPKLSKRSSAVKRQAANPDLGALIRGGGGIRKVRVAVGSRGKRGGARVIYYWAVRKDVILPLYAYPKCRAADLAPKQVLQLAKVVKEEFGSEKTDV